jgi:hypothetical protein
VVRIYSAAGQLVLTATAPREIVVDALAPGIYVVQSVNAVMRFVKL